MIDVAKEFRPVLPGETFVTIHEGTCEQEVLVPMQLAKEWDVTGVGNITGRK